MLQFRMVTKPGSLKALVLLAPGAASFQTLSTNRKRSVHILLMIKNRTPLTNVSKTKSCKLQPKMLLSKQSSHSLNLGGQEEQFPPVLVSQRLSLKAHLYDDHLRTQYPECILRVCAPL